MLLLLLLMMMKIGLKSILRGDGDDRPNTKEEPCCRRETARSRVNFDM